MKRFISERKFQQKEGSCPNTSTLIFISPSSPDILRVNMKAIFAPFAAITSLIVFSSCSTTVYDRIEDNPEVFNALSPSEKDFVSKGQIQRGMSQSAVKLVWGEPDSISTGVLDGKHSERWLYSNGGGGGWSFGVGGGVGRGRSTGYGLGTGISVPVGYVPANYSYVLFKDGKVDSWEGTGK